MGLAYIGILGVYTSGIGHASQSKIARCSLITISIAEAIAQLPDAIILKALSFLRRFNPAH